MALMNRDRCLNAYHRAYTKRMRRAALRRSKQPPMSPAEFMAQVQRLRAGSPPNTSAA